MANEVKVVAPEQATVLIQPNYNRKVGDKVICISIKATPRKNKTTGITFMSIKGLKHIPVINEEGVNIGKKNRWLDVHFNDDAFKKDRGEDLEVSTPNDLKTGFLYVKAKYIQSPRVYKIVEEKDNDGNVIYNEDGTAKLKYPNIWISGGIVGFEEYVSDQDEFNYVAPDEQYAVDAETGEILEDEETGEILNDEEVKL